jgi:hypothetical protein
MVKMDDNFLKIRKVFKPKGEKKSPLKSLKISWDYQIGNGEKTHGGIGLDSVFASITHQFNIL